MHATTFHHRASAHDDRWIEPTEAHRAGFLLGALPVAGIGVSLFLAGISTLAPLTAGTATFLHVLSQVLLMISIMASLACLPASLWLLWPEREDAAV